MVALRGFLAGCIALCVAFWLLHGGLGLPLLASILFCPFLAFLLLFLGIVAFLFLWVYPSLLVTDKVIRWRHHRWVYPLFLRWRERVRQRRRTRRA